MSIVRSDAESGRQDTVLYGSRDDRRYDLSNSLSDPTREKVCRPKRAGDKFRFGEGR